MLSIYSNVIRTLSVLFPSFCYYHIIAVDSCKHPPRTRSTLAAFFKLTSIFDITISYQLVFEKKRNRLKQFRHTLIYDQSITDCLHSWILDFAEKENNNPNWGWKGCFPKRPESRLFNQNARGPLCSLFPPKSIGQDNSSSYDQFHLLIDFLCGLYIYHTFLWHYFAASSGWHCDREIRPDFLSVWHFKLPPQPPPLLRHRSRPS